MEYNLPILFVFLALCGGAGIIMLNRYGLGFAGFLLGFFGGPFGLLIAWIWRDDRKQDELMTMLEMLSEAIQRSTAAASEEHLSPPYVPDSPPQDLSYYKFPDSPPQKILRS